jgi:hypothetical protein
MKRGDMFRVHNSPEFSTLWMVLEHTPPRSRFLYCGKNGRTPLYFISSSDASQFDEGWEVNPLPESR